MGNETARRAIHARDLNWWIVLGIAGMHVGCVAAPFYVSWSGLLLAGVLVWLTGGIGITLCYHRLLCHRSFKTPKWLEYILAVIGSLAWQGGPLEWVGTHRLHHRYSDVEGDPHSPKHGFAWAHVFWCMMKHLQGRQAVEAARDLGRDPFLRFLNRYHVIPQLLLTPLLFLGGEWARMGGLDASGLSWVLWGICVRTVLVYHGTWFVNSASHTWGYRNFVTEDGSTNLWWVALLSFGEGWHNNHHAHQRSAAHGLRWFELDVTYATIRLLALVGLAHDVILPAKGDLPRAGRDDAKKAAFGHGKSGEGPRASS